MVRLHQLAVLTRTLACYLYASPCLASQGYCSLRVRVLAPNGQRPEAPVSVREKSGRKEEKMQGISEDVLFCDLGILPVTVVVGQEGCFQVVVKDVPLSWSQPYMLRVTYDAETCTEEKLPQPKPLCRALFEGHGSRWEVDQ